MSATADDLETRVRERAYYLWQQDGCPSGRDAEFWRRAREAERQQERGIDRASEDSFPASDPPANTGITGAGALPDKPPGRR